MVTSVGGNWCVGEMYTRLGDDQGDPTGGLGKKKKKRKGGAEEGKDG